MPAWCGKTSEWEAGKEFSRRHARHTIAHIFVYMIDLAFGSCVTIVALHAHLLQGKAVRLEPPALLQRSYGLETTGERNANPAPISLT